MIPVLAGNASSGLRGTLDPSVALQALRRAWGRWISPEGGLKVERVHFSGRRPTVIHYRLTRPAKNAHGALPSLLMAELIGAEAASHAAREVDRLSKSRRGKLDLTDGPVVAADCESGLVFRRPRYDARLPGLRLLRRPEEASEIAAQALGVAIEGRAAHVSLRAHRLSKRAVLEIALGSEPDAPRVFARLRPVSGDGGAAAYARHVQIASGLAGNKAIRVPAALGHLPEMGAALYAAMPGIPLRFDPSNTQPIDQVLRALCAFQTLPSGDWNPHSLADEFALLEGWVSHVETHLPVFGGPARRAFESAAENLDALLPLPPGPCHRDLHEGQVLVGSRAACLLDFDTVRRGDPALDAGNLVAHARLAALRGGTRPLDLTDRIAHALNLSQRRIEAWARISAIRLACIYAFTSERGVFHRLIDTMGA